MPSGDDLDALRSATKPTLLVEPDPGSPGRVALLPGSFDPITVAHAALADAAREWAEAVVLVYSVRTVGKNADAEPALLSESERIEALEGVCAVRSQTVLGLCSHGLLVEQVSAAAERFPGAELALVVGSDKVLQVFDPVWYADRAAALDDLFGRADMRYALRAGDEDSLGAIMADPANQRWTARLRRMDVPPDVAAVSSRLVRALLRQGQDASALLPAGVQLPPAGNSHSR